MPNTTAISAKTIGRLSLYQRSLRELCDNGEEHVFSHDLAALTGCTPAQVRRDVMATGYSGSPARGYEVVELMGGIARFLGTTRPRRCALAGVGNLGRALLAYFRGQGNQYRIVGGFDADPAKAGRVVLGCRCFPMDNLREEVKRKEVELGLITVPAEAAQSVADEFVRAGVRGLVNFAPARLWVPAGVYVENVDVTMSLERAAFFARQTK